MKRSIGLWGVLLLAGVAVACGDDDKDSSSTSVANTASTTVAPYKISLATFPSVGGLGSFTAKDQGIFLRHGLDVDLVTLSVENLLPSLQSGTTAVAPQVLGDVIQYWQRDGDIRIISPLNEGIVWFLTGTSNTDIPAATGGRSNATMKGLEGKKLGVIGGRESGNAKILQALMREAGANPDRVEWIHMQTGGPMVAAITTGQVDVVYGDVATTLAAEQAGAKRLFDFRHDAPSLAGNVYSAFVSTDATLAKMPDLQKRFHAAIQETYEFMENPANINELKRIAVQVVKLPDSPTLGDAIAAQTEVQSAEVDMEQINRSIRFLIDGGLVPRTPEPTATDLFHDALLKPKK